MTYENENLSGKFDEQYRFPKRGCPKNVMKNILALRIKIKKKMTIFKVRGSELDFQCSPFNFKQHYEQALAQYESMLVADREGTHPL